MRSVSTVVAVLVLGVLGMIATIPDAGLTPGEMGLPRDARFAQPLDDDRLRTARQL